MSNYAMYVGFFFLFERKMNNTKNAEKKTTTLLNSKGVKIGIFISVLFALGFFVIILIYMAGRLLGRQWSW